MRMKKQKAGPLLAVSLCLLLLGGGIVVAVAMSSDNYSVDWSVLSTGGGPTGSDNYNTRSSITQTGIGPSSSDNYLSGSGYWYRGVKPAPGPAIPPNIISFAPPSPVSDTEGATRIFSITINQTVNVIWQINGTEVQTNASVTEASFTNTSAAVGTWNVSAVVTNTNGTDMQTWIWTVAPSPCYIATATYGTPLDSNIDVLRDFRDTVLMTNPIGKAFVSGYYATSPPIADALRENEGLRTVTRLTLITPLTYLSKSFLNGILVVVILGLTAVLLLRKDRMKILKSLLVGIGSIIVFIAAIFSLGFVGYEIPFCAVIGAYLLPFVIPLSVVFTLGALLKLHINVRKVTNVYTEFKGVNAK